MPSTTSFVLVCLLATSVLAAPAPHSVRSTPVDDDVDAPLALREATESSGELDERFFFLGPLIAQGIRAGVQAGVRAGVRAGAKKGMKAGAKHGAKQGAKQQNNNSDNNKGKTHKRDLEEDDLELAYRELAETEGELDERFFFLGPLIAQGIRAGVQAGVRAGVRAGAKKGIKAGANHGAKQAGKQHNNNNNSNNNNSNNKGKTHKRDLDDLDVVDDMIARSVPEEDLELDVAAREVESLEELD